MTAIYFVSVAPHRWRTQNLTDNICIYMYIYVCKVSIWNINYAQAIAFIFDSPTNVLARVSKFLSWKNVSALTGGTSVAAFAQSTNINIYILIESMLLFYHCKRIFQYELIPCRKKTLRLHCSLMQPHLLPFNITSFHVEFRYSFGITFFQIYKTLL